jgi:hypothetical protein
MPKSGRPPFAGWTLGQLEMDPGIKNGVFWQLIYWYWQLISAILRLFKRDGLGTKIVIKPVRRKGCSMVHSEFNS